MARRERVREYQEETFGETLNPAAAPVTYQTTRDHYFGVANLIYGILGIVELVLLLRFAFLLLGANASNAFVNFIYTLSQPLVAPFYGIFQVQPTVNGNLVAFDYSTLIAMAVYWLVAWILVRLAAAANNRPADPV